MTLKEIHDLLKQQFGESILELHEETCTPYLTVRSEIWSALAAVLRDHEALAFDYLRNLCGVDYPDKAVIHLVVHLYSTRHKHECGVKIVLNREAPRVNSVTDLWPAANWHEREAYDLFGIQFIGHPDPRRILLPDDWEGYPLRKDYRYPEMYHGINNLG